MGLPVSKCLQASFEAHHANFKVRFFFCLVHQPPHAVVGNEVHKDFFSYHFRRLAPQDVHPHGRLDVAKKQLDIPSPEVKLGQFRRRILHSIKQGGDDVKSLSSEPWNVHEESPNSASMIVSIYYPVLLAPCKFTTSWLLSNHDSPPYS